MYDVRSTMYDVRSGMWDIENRMYMIDVQFANYEYFLKFKLIKNE